MSVETQMALRNQSTRLQDGYILFIIVGNSGILQELGKARLRRNHCDDTVVLNQHLLGPSAPGELVMASIVGGGSEWRRMASNGGYKWYKVRRRITRWGERLREESDELCAPLSLLRVGCF